jgi:hypothetical protein
MLAHMYPTVNENRIVLVFESTGDVGFRASQFEWIARYEAPGVCVDWFSRKA